MNATKNSKLGLKDVKQHPFWQDTCKGSNIILHLNIESELNKLVISVESFSTPSTYTVCLYKWDGSIEMSEENLLEQNAQKLLIYWIVLYKKTANLGEYYEFEKTF